MFAVDDSGSAVTGAEDETAPEGVAVSPDDCGDCTVTDIVTAQEVSEDIGRSGVELSTDDMIVKVLLG